MASNATFAILTTTSIIHIMSDVPHIVLQNQTPGAGLSETTEATRWQKLAWVLYDCGNSGYGLVIMGPLFSLYFVRGLLPEGGLHVLRYTITGDGAWALCTAMGALMTAVCAPVLGAVADIKGWTKRLFITFAVTGALLAMTSIFLKPGMWLAGSVIFILSSFCFTTSITFYNAFLPVLTQPDRQGSLSGYGFAFGYIGGAMALIIAAMLLLPYAGIQIALAFSGAWWLAFSLPAFFLLKETQPQARTYEGSLLVAGFKRVGTTFTHVRQYKMLFIFLIAFLLYSNGTDTVINIAPAFAASVPELKMNETALVKVFLIVQFVAFGGALAFGWISDKIGDKRVILITLFGWIMAVACVFYVASPTQFTWAAVGIGVVLGGVQASSRSLMAKLSPPGIRNEAFGFFSLAGKAVSVVGPLCYFALSTATANPRMAVLGVVPFLVVGMMIMCWVKEPARDSISTHVV
jgi:MFS transporter, UMF1 family